MRTVKRTLSKSDEDSAPPAASDGLLGVPGLGPIRITALHAAGITTRAQLAQATVEQLISVTGMPRAQAEKTRAAVLGTASAATTPPPPTDELMPLAGTIGGPADRPAPEPTDPEPDTPPAADLDRALLTARTALADATRHFPSLDRPLIKFAIRLEKLPRLAAELTEKKQAKIAARLDKLTAHLEKASIPTGKETKARRERLQNRLESEEEKLLAIFPTKQEAKKERKPKHKK